MREIKFRAWDKGNKIWQYFTLQDLANGIAKLGIEFLENWCEYTGLKDKNGKEIYEGDIVKFLYSGWGSQHLGTPEQKAMSLDEYKDSIAEIKVVEWSYNGFYVSHKIGGYHETMEYGEHGYIEIIGNIYENPELLNN